jgi:FkbM family methyltransferase
MLKVHCERNEARQIAVMKTAVWDSSRELTFERSQEASSRMEGRINQGQASTGEMIRVAAISLDDFFFSDGRSEPPNPIKIDVEGGEFQVLSGARKLLSEFKPRILCEIHSREMVKPVEKLLGDCGYTFIESPAEAKSYVWVIPH